MGKDFFANGACCVLWILSANRCLACAPERTLHHTHLHSQDTLKPDVQKNVINPMKKAVTVSVAIMTAFYLASLWRS